LAERAKPLVRKGCGGVNLDLVPGYADGEGEDEIWRGEPGPRAFRPLDEPEAPRPGPVAQADRVELAFIAQAVEVDVKDGQAAQLMELEERIGGTSDRLNAAQSAQESPRKGGLTCSKIAGEVEDRQVAIGRPGERELAAKLFSLLRRLGRDAHAAARG